MNCLFKHVIDGVELSVVAEVQIYSTAILEIKKDGHKAGARDRRRFVVPPIIVPQLT